MISVVDDAERARLMEIILRESAEDDVASQARGLANDSTIHLWTMSSAHEELVIAVQAQAGRTGYVWPPKAVGANSPAGEASGDSRTRQEMLQHVTTKLSEDGIRMAQALLDPTDIENRAAFAAAGFTHLADLAYIGAEETEFPTALPNSKLEFLPCDAEQFETQSFELAQVIERTYVDTQDCPAMSDMRSMSDALEGYRGVGRFDPANWFLIRCEGQNAGCLILADQLQSPIPALELVYMGIVPEARGNGFGVDAVRFAQWRARELGAARLVLAVDASNQPALAMYAECGFGLWGQRAVMVKRLEE